MSRTLVFITYDARGIGTYLIKLELFGQTAQRHCRLKTCGHLL
ncbi:MAG: hypothetical protein P4M11_02055 [Candidatus Pacebacteria bacterium]|nr:hypothetical protein [Candidatus Paceibacterota bacterium]